jgi:exportin-2 (importin alpha re-exporter)
MDFLADGQPPRFSQADIHEIAPGLLNVLLTKIESARTAEKVAENDHLMKCTSGLFYLWFADLMFEPIPGTMRVIVTARQTLTPGHSNTLQRLVAILGVISRNPSNPNFDQYIFESISALMRYTFFLSFLHICEG